MNGIPANTLRLFLVFAVGVLISSRAWSEPKPVEMIVSLKNAKTVAVRQAPNPEAVALAFVENGKPLRRKGLEETNGFVMVQLGDGRTGWTKSAFLAPIPVSELVAPQGIAATPAVNAPPVPQAVPASGGSASGKEMPAVGILPELPVSVSHVPPGVPLGDSLPLTREDPVPATTRARTELWVIGLVGVLGMLIGLVIGGKAGAVYATKSIHERYEVIN